MVLLQKIQLMFSLHITLNELIGCFNHMGSEQAEEAVVMRDLSLNNCTRQSVGHLAQIICISKLSWKY